MDEAGESMMDISDDDELMNPFDDVTDTLKQLRKGLIIFRIIMKKHNFSLSWIVTHDNPYKATSDETF